MTTELQFLLAFGLTALPMLALVVYGVFTIKTMEKELPEWKRQMLVRCKELREQLKAIKEEQKGVEDEMSEV